MKTCTKCEEEKPLSEFYKKSASHIKSNMAEIDTYRSYCKLCKKRYEETNKDRINAQKRTHYKANRPRLLAKARLYIKKNFKKKQLTDKLYHAAHKEKRNAYTRQWNKDNKEKAKLGQKRWREQNKEHVKKYLEENRPSTRARARIRRKERYRNDPLYKCRVLVRGAVREGFRKKNFHKRHKTSKILKCSFEYFFNYVKKQFKEGMTWKNHGEWELDHIIPLGLAETEEEVIALNHYSNFQPLWKKENGSGGKSNKLILTMISPENKVRYKGIIERALKNEISNS
tara:strand:- start:580 stop:1434 length:855 start_codon:yes stop_codon:yes gene_type:complete